MDGKTTIEKRKDAFWEDHYHSTAIEKGRLFLRCIVYNDMNMIRTGVVGHPRDWVHGGYVDIQNPWSLKIALCTIG
jgi:putative transposase